MMTDKELLEMIKSNRKSDVARAYFLGKKESNKSLNEELDLDRLIKCEKCTKTK